ncbi:MAG: hypothetical protein JW771_04190, partial [Candidatus Thermoplasmatota archaeon]|nr:hypothetical protein [Candidatus Thermoplasmatota archaeon]
AEGVWFEIPDNFDSMIAELHSHEKKAEESKEIQHDLPETKALYYDDHYTKTFTAQVLWKNTTNRGTELILDQTAFYPEGGGQPADRGVLHNNGSTFPVMHVEKRGKAIVHIIDGELDVGDSISGAIDWDHRYTLMKHHTGTHVVNGALRKLLGEHIWQAGSQLELSDARFDFAHYKTITEEERKHIEQLANEMIQKGQQVEKKVMDRNSAEKTHGFRLYQGGVPPGNCIRVLNIPGIDVEACGGTHLNNINEIEKIRIIKTERIQDGVNRIVFAASAMADEYQQREKQKYTEIENNLPLYEIINKDNVSEQLKEASKLLSVQTNQLKKTLDRLKTFEEDRLMKSYSNVIDSFNLSKIYFKQLNKAIQPSQQLQDAFKLSEQQLSQLQKAIEPSKQLQEAANRAAKQSAEQLKQLQKAIEPSKQLQEAAKQLADQSKHFNLLSQQLVKEIDRSYKKRTKKDLIEVSSHLLDEWKKTQKDRKKVSSNEIEELKQKAEQILDTKIKIITAKTNTEGTSTGGAITKEDNYIVHLYDGKKLVSMASENIDVDLRNIAPEIGKILGGSGGGKPRLTQCGGPNKKRVDEALQKAKELTILALQKQM